MAHSLIRFAAGVGAVVTVTVTGGLDAAVSSADPGGPRTPSSESRDANHSRGDGYRGRPPSDAEHRGDPGHDGPPATGGEQPTVTAGGGTPYLPAPQAASGGSVAEPAPSEPAPSEPAPSEPAPSEPAPEVSAPATSGGRSSGRSGAGRAGTPFTAPRVVFGDGRSPGLRSGRRADVPAPAVVPVATSPLPASPAPPALPPVVPVLVVAPAPLVRAPWSPDIPVTSLWDGAQPGWPAGVIFGIAGLLLAPIGGIWLGQRQARASKSAAQLVSR